jgi:hypothetical protein
MNEINPIKVKYDGFEVSISPQVINSTLRRYGLSKKDLREHIQFLEYELISSLKKRLGEFKVYTKSDDIYFTLELFKPLKYRVIGARISQDVYYTT